MILDDVNKDIKSATADEEASIKDYEEFMRSSEAAIEKIDSDVAELEGEIGDARASRADEKKVLDETLMYLRSIAEGCDFMAANFELRKSNREAETDGLLEAEAALTGGS